MKRTTDKGAPIFRLAGAVGAMIAFGAAVVGPVAAEATKAAPAKVAVFPFELIDDSQEGEVNGVRADQTARLRMITDELIVLMKADGRYVPVDIAPIAADIERESPIHKCHSCEDKLTAKVGAELAVIGTVQKVSNLILNINVYVRDVAKERFLRVESVDLRGNTDESWVRSLRYLVKNRLFVDKETPK